MNTFLGVGSNIAPEANLAAALVRLSQVFPVLAVSPVYRSPALDRPEQPDYLNAVWAIEADRAHEDLKHRLRAIEAACGRTRVADRYAPRTIDLDVILLRGELLDRDVFKRPFIARPLADLAPELDLEGRRARDVARALGMDGLKRDPLVTHRLQEMVAG